MNHPEPSAPLLSVRNVSKRYGDRLALQGASFDLWPGEVLAVVGESGSGKSTLLNAIAARSAPDEGTVQFRQRSGRFGHHHNAARILIEPVYHTRALNLSLIHI